MAKNRGSIERLYQSLPPDTRELLDRAINSIVSAKRKGGKVVVVTGSGPNLHEGVTTLIAELMRLGVVDGVTTSSAVVAHEMGGVLDKVRRVDGRALGVSETMLPHGGTFELTLLDEATLETIAEEMPVDHDLIERMREAPGQVIIKAAGNLGYPMGLYIERLASEIESFVGEARSPGDQNPRPLGHP